MNLSDKAKNHLRDILITQIGKELVETLTDDDLNQIGLFLLTVHAEALKAKV